jgi:hypothetical protein|tara:strand:+ start:122 stop:469 length:348 start_codon:yes stop_codon:yes gene_type:complete
VGQGSVGSPLKRGRELLIVLPNGNPLLPSLRKEKKMKKFFGIEAKMRMRYASSTPVSKSKEKLRQEFSDMVDEYVKNGGVIEQVPIHVNANYRKSKTRPGFDREKILLNEEKHLN